MDVYEFMFRDYVHRHSGNFHLLPYEIFLSIQFEFYDLVYLTLLQCSRPSIPSDDRLLRSFYGRRLGKREIKMIYHPRIAGAHTIKKDQRWLFYAFYELMPSPHWPPTTLHQLRQRCNSLGCSIATCPAISLGALKQAPRMHHST